MTPINYPFNYDSVSYFGLLAKAYNQPDLLDGLRQVWGLGQGTLLLSTELVFAKFFGFSYVSALWVQAGLAFLLALLILGLLFSVLREGFPDPFEKVHPYSLFLGMALSAVSSLWVTGYFHAQHGNIFEFRLDMISALLMTGALFSLPRRDWTTVAWIALSVLERFHSITILIPTIALWAWGDAAMQNGSKAGSRLFRKALENAKFPILGLGLVFLLKGQILYQLGLYYLRGHFGPEKAMRGWSWSRPDYWSFYFPGTWKSEYVERATWNGLVGLFVLFFVFQGWSGGIQRLKNWANLVSPAWIGAGITYLLLLADPTRNNFSVLRYVIGPLAYCLAAALVFLAPWKRAGIAFSALAFLALWSGANAYHRWAWFYDHFDYREIRTRDLVGQLDPIFRRVYQESQSSKGRIEVASNFALDLNFSPEQWEIYEATHGLKPLPYSLELGQQYFANEGDLDFAKIARKVDYFAWGTPGCSDLLPLAKQLEKTRGSLEKIVKSRCLEPIGEVHLWSCDIEVLKCAS